MEVAPCPVAAANRGWRQQEGLKKMDEKLKHWIRRNWFPCILYALLVFMVVALWSINYHPVLDHDWFGPSGLETKTNAFWFTMFAESIIVLVAFVAGHILIGVRQKKHREPIYKEAYKDACIIYDKVYDLVYDLMAQEDITNMLEYMPECYREDMKEKEATEIIRAFIQNKHIRIDKKGLISRIDFLYSEVENYLQRFGTFLISPETEMEGSELLENFSKLRRGLREFQTKFGSYRTDEAVKEALDLNIFFVFENEYTKQVWSALENFRKNLAKKQQGDSGVEFHKAKRMIEKLKASDSAQDKKNRINNIFVWAALFNMYRENLRQDNKTDICRDFICRDFWRLYWDHVHRHGIHRHVEDEQRAEDDFDVLKFLKFLPSKKNVGDKYEVAVYRDLKKHADREAVKVFEHMSKDKESKESIAQGNFYLGLTYWFGACGGDRKERYRSATRCFCEAAKNGHSKAKYYLGIATMYGYPSSKAGTYTEAWRYFQEAGKKDDADALNELGILYMHALTVPRDDKKAVECFHKAAEMGHPHAQNNLGIMYSEGWGVDQSATKAGDLFRKARKNGNKDAGINLGVMYLRKPDMVSGNAMEEAARLFREKKINARTRYYYWHVCDHNESREEAKKLGSFTDSPSRDQRLEEEAYLEELAARYRDYEAPAVDAEEPPEEEEAYLEELAARYRDYEAPTVDAEEPPEEEEAYLEELAARYRDYEAPAVDAEEPPEETEEKFKETKKKVIAWNLRDREELASKVKELIEKENYEALERWLYEYRKEDADHFYMLREQPEPRLLTLFRVEAQKGDAKYQYYYAFVLAFLSTLEPRKIREMYEKAYLSSNCSNDRKLRNMIQYRLGLNFLYQGRKQDFDMAKQDFDMARKCFLTAAKGEIPGAQYWVGLMCREGLGGPENPPAKAKGWFKKAADLGHLRAAYQLGLMCFDGHGSEGQDYKAGKEYFERVIPKAELEVDFLREDYPWVLDTTAELRWDMTQPSGGGDPLIWRDQADALARLGFIYMHGHGNVKQCDNMAVCYFEEAAKARHADAMFNLGLIYLKRDCNSTKAKEMFEMAWAVDVEYDGMGPCGARRQYGIISGPLDKIGPGNEHLFNRNVKTSDRLLSVDNPLPIGEDWWPRYRGNWVALRFLESLYRDSDKAERCREKFEMTGFSMPPVPNLSGSPGKTDASSG